MLHAMWKPMRFEFVNCLKTELVCKMLWYFANYRIVTGNYKNPRQHENRKSARQSANCISDMQTALAAWLRTSVERE